MPAQAGLGLCYFDGTGVEQSDAEAVKWFRAAAEQGDERAQYFLGACYIEGAGVKRSRREGIKWSRSAAEQGSEDALNLLQQLGVKFP